MSATAAPTGSAGRWGPLWGARPDGWALSEVQHVPGYEAALQRVGLEPGHRVLDIGCGTGVFLRLVAERSGHPFGLDASEALIEAARRRVPEADLRVGDMESLPYGDERFDLVTGFTSFFFATDIVDALREAGRVAKPGAPVVIQVWGAPERCQVEAMKVIARPFLPPPPPGAPSNPELWRPGALEEFAGRAGLIPEATFDMAWAYEYPDEATLGRAMLAPAGLGAIVGLAREQELRSAILDGLAPCRTAAGAYRLENEYRYLVARAS